MYLKSVGGLTSTLLMLVCLYAASADDFRSEEVSFKIDVEAYIYILWIARDPAEHDWLQDNYTLLEGDEVGSTDEALKVFKSNDPFAAGEVKTYAANTGSGLYIIVLEATGKMQAVVPSNELPITWGWLKKN